MELNEISSKAMGGTELMMHALSANVSPDLLEHFQIIPSRVRQLDDSKIKIYYLHDLPEDPESAHLANGGWNKFDLLVFVSNWQMQAYQKHFGLPWHKCVVMRNAIDPVKVDIKNKPSDVIKLIYHTTPHRGLNLLVPVFEKLCETYDNIELDVYSSFKIYGWEERDAPYQELFDRCKAHPKINYYGTVSNSEVKQALANAHIFAYPSIWLETSCISLIEAMSAGLTCVHPNYGALYETASNWNWMYQYHSNQRDHAKVFYDVLSGAIDTHVNKKQDIIGILESQKIYTDAFYGWNTRKLEWHNLLINTLKSVKNIDFYK